MFGEKFTGAEFTAMKAKGLSPYVVPSSLLIQAFCLERSPLCCDSISVKERRLFLLRLWGWKERRTRCFPGLASWGRSDTQGIIDAGPDCLRSPLFPAPAICFPDWIQIFLGKHTLTMTPPVPKFPMTSHFSRGCVQAPWLASPPPVCAIIPLTPPASFSSSEAQFLFSFPVPLSHWLSRTPALPCHGVAIALWSLSSSWAQSPCRMGRMLFPFFSLTGWHGSWCVNTFQMRVE